MAMHDDGQSIHDRIRRANLASVLDALADEVGAAEPIDLHRYDEATNELFQVRYADGRALMIKRALHPRSVPYFDAATRASHALLTRTSVIAPRHLRLPAELFDLPVLAYWRIRLPTMKRAWKRIPTDRKPAAMRSWGELIARMHDVGYPGYGALVAAEREATELEPFLRRHLGERVLPKVRESWSAGAAAVERMIEAVPAVAARVGSAGGVLVHNDLYMENVLCERKDDGGVRCVGVIDLETAYAGPPEADLARPMVLYGPVFGDLSPRLMDALFEGYGERLDPVALAFFRAMHLVNLGLHCARQRHTAHAVACADAAGREAQALTDFGESSAA